MRIYTHHSERLLQRGTQPPINRRPSARNTNLGYLPGLDGLRAFAVVAVLLYHANLSWIPGGFLGVEIFFVISGYLITALLLAEWRQQGRINLATFWLRRARRLLPALFVLLTSTLAFAVIFLPDEVAALRDDALAAFAYITNWHFVLGQKSYFATVGRPSLLQHLWSLAVEEQFYVLWPLILAGSLRRWSTAKILRAVLLGAGISTLLMTAFYQFSADPSRAYYGTDTRAAGLLMGSALAFVWVPHGERQGRTNPLVPVLLDLIGFGALAALVWYCLRINAYQPGLYRGGFLAVAITTVVAIAVAVHPRAHLSSFLLERSILRWIGVRSYSIYLWHWPIFMLTRPQLDVPLAGISLLTLRLLLTLLFAEISFRYVEVPLRTGALGRAWRSLQLAHGAHRWQLSIRWLGAVGTIAIMSVVLGRAVANARPPAEPAYLAASAAPSATPIAATQATTAISTTTGSTITPSRSVTALGDSVMNGAAAALHQSISTITVDAAQARQADNMIDLLRTKQAAGQLSEVVVVHIGNNGPLNNEQFDQIMQILVDVPSVVFVNVKVPRFWEGPNNSVLAEGIKRYPKATLVDWYGASINRPELFWDDGIHLRPEGAAVYAQLVSQGIK